MHPRRNNKYFKPVGQYLQVDIRESQPKGGCVLLKGTKWGAFSCVTRPKAVSVTGLFDLER